MAESTAIEWTDHTFNPWWGCEKVSPGCAHCYAEGVSNHRAGKGLWGAEHRFRFFGDDHWAHPLRWNRASERDVRDQVGLKRRHRVFCASMADVFEERDELEEHRLRLFNLIDDTPHLDWQVLTKRPEFARAWLDTQLRYLPNVWLGVSIENARYTWRADVLREIPAAVRFLSCEPLLGSLFPPSRVEIDARYGSEALNHLDLNEPKRKPLDLTGIDWVIIGGESGPKARPMRLEWAREIVQACYEAAGVECCGQPHVEYECCGNVLPSGECCSAIHGGYYMQPVEQCCGQPVPSGPRPAIFVKQLGAKPINSVTRGLQAGRENPLPMRDRKGGDLDEWPADLRIREFPAPAAVAPDSRPCLT